MKINKYSAIYRNDAITFDGDDVVGIVKNVKEFFKYQLASQCMGFDTEYENFIDNARMIVDLIEELNNNEKDTEKIKVFFNPMGALQYTKEGVNDEK